MSGSFCVESLYSEEFLKEIHHLLWQAPFNNNGAMDGGWNCRDHALIVALILCNFGIPSAVCSGKITLVTGPNGKDHPHGIEVDPHSWNFIPGADWLDASVRVSRDFSSWRNWKIEGVFGGAVRANLATTHLITNSDTDFENGVNAATHEPGGHSLIYLMKSHVNAEKIPLGDLTRWVDSPRSRWITTKFASDRIIYIKAAYHLLKLLEGRRNTLTTIVKSEAWHQISLIGDDEVISSMPKLCGLALSNRYKELTGS